MKTALLAAAALIFLGCASVLVGRPRSALKRFPIGIYGVASAGDLPAIKDAGFDSFAPDAPKAELAGLARKLGLRMLANPASLFAGPAPRNWPIEAWYLADEPDVNGISPERLADLSRQARAWDPVRAQAFVVGEGSQTARYGGLADIVMLDWYPVPHLKLDSVADQIDLAYSSMPPGKPLWMVVQAFDWRREPQSDPKKPRVGRFPTHAEIRFMSYLALVHGARGLFYFQLHGLDQPELWLAVSRVSREIKALQPILERGREIKPGVSGEDGFESKAWSYRGRTYLAVVNRRNAPVLMPAELLETWRPLFESRRDPRDLLLKTGSGFSLRPYQTMVLEGRFRLKDAALGAW